MKVLWHSQTVLSKSGYSIQTALLAPHVAKLEGIDLTLSASNHTGSPQLWKGIRMLPGGWADKFGNDVIQYHADNAFGEMTKGMVFVLLDIWVLSPSVMRGLKVAAWTPVDHVPVQQRTQTALRQMHTEEAGCIPVAMTRDSQQEFAKAGFDAPYIPHAVDTEVFKPLDRKECREALGLPEDAFIIAVVADNQGIAPPRKAFPQILEAFKKFRNSRKDALLLLHTDTIGTRGGLPLDLLMSQLDLPEGSVAECDQYQYRITGFPQGYLAAVYSSANVLLNPSYGEGFGVTILEAQSCGTPVIVNDFGAMKEVGGVGWHTENVPWYTKMGGWQAMPLADSIVDRLQAAYQRADTLREKAREFALGYDVAKVTEDYFAPALKELADRLEID